MLADGVVIQVLARRAFKLFLYRQLLACNEEHPCENNILEYHNEKGKWLMRSDVTVHLYSSSQPCGNATLKRWAKARKEKFLNCACDELFPTLTHSKFHVTAREVRHTICAKYKILFEIPCLSYCA